MTGKDWDIKRNNNLSQKKNSEQKSYFIINRERENWLKSLLLFLTIPDNFQCLSCIFGLFYSRVFSSPIFRESINWSAILLPVVGW
jgi:hypothetical protein